MLVGHDGQVKVIDFGVAKAASNQLRTNVGQMKGKVAYMAPEQALGDPVDRRTDIFALGVVLYQLLTGKHPFRGDNEFATLGRIRNKEPIEPPKRILPSLPDDVNDIIVKALSKPREGRFQTMVELGRALEKASPTKESGNDDLAAFMKSILGGRAEKKRAAIREAMVRVDEKQPVEALVPSAFTESKTLDSESFQQMLASLPAEARASDLFSPSSTRSSSPSSTRSSSPSTPTPPVALGAAALVALVELVVAAVVDGDAAALVDADAGAFVGVEPAAAVDGDAAGAARGAAERGPALGAVPKCPTFVGAARRSRSSPRRWRSPSDRARDLELRERLERRGVDVGRGPGEEGLVARPPGA